MSGIAAEGLREEETLRVGIDLVRISRVASSIERFGDRFISRLFTADERRYCEASAPLAPGRFAARLAAKEAVLKVLLREDEPVSPRSIEVRRHAAGHCDIVLHDGAAALAARAGIAALALSMSHEGDYAAAVVVAERTRIQVGGA